MYPLHVKEIKGGITRLKAGKTGGPDLILNEFIKEGSNTLVLTPWFALNRPFVSKNSLILFCRREVNNLPRQLVMLIPL
jgi:hypothetical protein